MSVWTQMVMHVLPKDGTEGGRNQSVSAEQSETET